MIRVTCIPTSFLSQAMLLILLTEVTEVIEVIQPHQPPSPTTTTSLQLMLQKNTQVIPYGFNSHDLLRLCKYDYAVMSESK